MYDNLVNILRAYADTTSGIEKQKYVVLAKSLSDDDFVWLLDDNTKRRIDELQNLLSRNNRDFAWVRERQGNYVDIIDSIYFDALSFEVAKTRNIAHFEERTTELEKSITTAKKNIEHINSTAKLISGASVLAEYAKEFDGQADMHKDSAISWAKWLAFSIFGLALLVTILLFFQVSEFTPLKNLFADDFRQSGHLDIIALSIKAAILLAYLQVPYFIKRNYFAEKHLQQANLHRRNVLKALHAVYNTIQDQSEKDKIIVTGAAIAFSEVESGYITRREGAGGDDLTETLVTKLWN